MPLYIIGFAAVLLFAYFILKDLYDRPKHKNSLQETLKDLHEKNIKVFRYKEADTYTKLFAEYGVWKYDLSNKPENDIIIIREIGKFGDVNLEETDYSEKYVSRGVLEKIDILDEIKSINQKEAEKEKLLEHMNSDKEEKEAFAKQKREEIIKSRIENGLDY